jgi:hypothetical protein
MLEAAMWQLVRDSTAIALEMLKEAEFVAQVLHMLAALTPTLVAAIIS